MRSLLRRGECRSFRLKLQGHERIKLIMIAAEAVYEPLDLPDTHSYTARMISLHKCSLLPVLLLFCSIVVAGVGCSGKTIQYPEDHERYLLIDRAVESLRHAYVKKDASGLAAVMMPLDQLERLQEEARADFETYSAMTLDFSLERIMIEGDDIDVFVHWQGLWKKDADDPGLRQRGHTRLQWVGTKSVLLRGVQGDAPFGMKARQAATDSTQTPKKK